MAELVVNGAQCKCSFGAAPSALLVLPAKMVNGQKLPVATIADAVPMTNILPFGMCSSPTNPAVIAATAAASGVFTPAPCTPATVAWAPGKPMVLVGKTPALDKDATCPCSLGGVISVANPGQVNAKAT